MNKLRPDGRVAYLGPAGTYTHAAALQWFGAEAHWLPVAEIQEVFAAIQNGTADYGVVPVENSNEGSVTATLDCFITASVLIRAELKLRIRHCLLARADTLMGDIVKIASHQQSLGQCRQWLAKTLPGVERLAVSSNAEAARLAGAQQGVAAIAGHTAATLYGLAVLAESIEDSPDNTTRFLLLTKDETPAPSGRDKTSVIFSVRDEPGTLLKALEPLHFYGVNLSKLESRPSRKAAWSYSFYVDLEGHAEDAKVRQALQALRESALDVKSLGSYPAAEAS